MQRLNPMKNNHELVFISYSHHDSSAKNGLIKHLKALQWSRPQLQSLVDSHLPAGEKWELVVGESIQQAGVAVLLITPAYLQSKLIRQKELPIILNRQRNDNVKIMPVIVEPCEWESTALGSLRVWPQDRKPLNTLDPQARQRVWVNIAGEINRLHQEAIGAADRISVMIADDHPYVIKGIQEIIAESGDMFVVAGCSSPQEVEEKATIHKPDVILLDLSWFRNDDKGYELIGILRTVAPSSKIIAMSNYPGLFEQAKQLGAFILEKSFTVNQLYAKIREVHKSNKVIPVTPLKELTSREVDVLRELKEGYSDKEVAEGLSISINTAKKHVSNIIGKLGARSRTHAVVIAMEQNLI